MKRFFFVAAIMMVVAQTAMADAVLPDADIAGAKDPSYLGRYEGARIVAYQHNRFDRFVLPLAGLQEVAGKRDTHNNRYFAPETSKTLEGERTRLVYLLPAERTPLEVLKNYLDEVTAKGGRPLFECEKGGCGGDPGRASSGGGGEMSLGMFMQAEEEVAGYNKPFSNGYCALTSRIADQHYFSAELPEQHAYLSVLTYRVSSGSFCKTFNNRTVAVVDAVQVKEREQKMIVVKAAEMERKIEQEGRIALYGIFFDTDKAVVKDSSKPTLDEIAAMLKGNPDRKILVVGHTDNEGSFAYNRKLSERRAAAVVDRLVNAYGIAAARLHPVGASYACPAASNATEEGRAKNRRVVLVGE